MVDGGELARAGPECALGAVCQQRQCRQGYVEPIRMEALAMESTWGGWVHVGIQVERVATQHARSNEILKPSGLKPCEHFNLVQGKLNRCVELGLNCNKKFCSLLKGQTRRKHTRSIVFLGEISSISRTWHKGTPESASGLSLLQSR